MPLENSSTISGLDKSWPLGGDPKSRGDDHIRLIKSVLKGQFPGAGGQGYDKPISASEDEVNHLTGTVSNVHDDIADLKNLSDMSKVNLYAPKGTKITFFNAHVPVGWTLVTTYNDYMMRVVNSGGGATGGTHSPVSTSFRHSHTTPNHILTPAQMPNHSHTLHMTRRVTGDDAAGFGPVLTAGRNIVGANNTVDGMQVLAAGGNAGHNHGNTGAGDLNFTPKYLNVIIGEKD